MNRSRAQPAFWNDQAKTYDHSWRNPAKSAMSERELILLAEFGGAMHVERALDVGSGTGRILARHLEATDVQRLYGMDASEEMVRTCRSRFAGEDRVAGLVVADLTGDLPFDGGFDVITAIRMLKYAETWRSNIAKLAGLLRVGGILVFSMPNHRSLNRFSRPYGVDWYSTTRDELLDVTRRASLEPLAVRGATRLPYSLYERVGGRLLNRSLEATDVALDRVFGTALGARELFVAARRVA